MRFIFGHLVFFVTLSQERAMRACDTGDGAGDEEVVVCVPRTLDWLWRCRFLGCLVIAAGLIVCACADV